MTGTGQEQDRTGRGRTGQYRTGRDRTGQTGLDMNKPGHGWQDRTGRGRTGQSKTGRGRAEQGGQDRTATGQEQDRTRQVTDQILTKEMSSAI